MTSEQNDNKLNSSYIDKMRKKIRSEILSFQCQPILFIGSGISRRYINSPNWIELLDISLKFVPDNKLNIDYLCQKYSNNLAKVGTEISDIIFEYAWGNGKNFFPEE